MGKTAKKVKPDTYRIVPAHSRLGEYMGAATSASGAYWVLFIEPQLGQDLIVGGHYAHVPTLYSFWEVPVIWKCKAFPTRKLREELSRLAALPWDWDSEGAEPPSPIAVQNAETAIQILEEMAFEPTRLDPSAANGLGIVFRSGRRYAHLEILNSGKIQAATFDENENTESWPVAQSEGEMKEALETIRAFIRA